MNKNDILQFKSWFDDYCRGFYTDNPTDNENIRLKQEHTHRVCLSGISIAQGLGMDERETLIAEACCLFHDIARFEQYKQYKTFKDADSVNHGVYGANILQNLGILSSLPLAEQGIILQSVKYHNAFSVPQIEDTDVLRFLKLVRDADKLDIWYIFYHYYIKGTETMPSAMGLGLPDTEGYSPALVDALLNKRLARLVDIKNINDFKLLKISWIYDINYSYSMRIIKENRCLDMILQTLPQDDTIARIRDCVNAYMEQASR